MTGIGVEKHSFHDPFRAWQDACSSTSKQKPCRRLGSARSQAVDQL
jgi:hypothetical protein